MENYPADCHQYPYGHRYYARCDELHVMECGVWSGEWGVYLSEECGVRSVGGRRKGHGNTHTTINPQIHSSLNIPHSTFHPPHSTFHTQHSALHTQHSTLKYTPHSTLHIPHSKISSITDYIRQRNASRKRKKSKRMKSFVTKDIFITFACTN